MLKLKGNAFWEKKEVEKAIKNDGIVQGRDERGFLCIDYKIKPLTNEEIKLLIGEENGK
jgi:hypothetical protein